jgi:hypothetical protein
MARQEDTCWHCGARWASEDGPRTTLKVTVGGARGPIPAGPRPTIAVAVATTARAASDAGLDADRWANEGGSFAFERLHRSVP